MAAGVRLAQEFPHKHQPLRAVNGAPVTQLEFARAGIITKEMAYIATRENLGREAALEGAKAALADGESFGAAVPEVHHARIRAIGGRARGRAP